MSETHRLIDKWSEEARRGDELRHALARLVVSYDRWLLNEEGREECDALEDALKEARVVLDRWPIRGEVTPPPAGRA